ncbi:MAG TPA: hypothetical protein VGP63_00175, partial [Planctomycetaceae bacterium]|nr:hypothetical protein [Planctomycetaceae bacterium]
LLPAAVLALAVGWADFRLANTARTAAAKISERVKGEQGTVWFEGHWGFQYYMLAAGGRDFDLSHPASKPGDILINPYNNTDVYFYGAEFLDSLGTFDFPACGWLTTVQSRLGAGFYSAIWGPLPYVFSRVPAERYAIWRLKLPSEFKLKESQD